MTKRPIENCYWVTPNQLLAGEYPLDIREDSSQGKTDALIKAGITSFIDLTEENEGLLPYDQLLNTSPSAAITYQRFPVRDFSVPRSHEFAAEILDAIDSCIKNGETVYLHCLGGVGRTGVVVGCWLSRQGLSQGSALDRLRELWKQSPMSAVRQSPETPEQEQYILQWKEKR